MKLLFVKLGILQLLIVCAIASDQYGWTKYLSDAQNTCSSNLVGPTGSLCAEIEFNMTDIYSSLTLPPVLSVDGYLFSVSSNSTTSVLQKYDTSTNSVIWTFSSPYKFTTHMLVDSNNVVWVGSDDCSLINFNETNGVVSSSILQLSSSCNESLTGGLAISNSMIIARSLDSKYLSVDTNLFPNDGCVKWVSSVGPLFGYYNNYGTVLIDPYNDNRGWDVVGNQITSINLQNGTIEQIDMNLNLGNDLITSSIVADPDSGRAYFTTQNNYIYCIDISNSQTPLWSKQFEGSSSTFNHRPSTPALSPDNNRVYVVIDYTFCSFDNVDGTLLYNITLKEENNMPLYLSVDKDEHVYFCSETVLYGIDGNTWDIIYQIDSPDLVYLDSALIISGNSTVTLQSGNRMAILTDLSSSCEDNSSSSSEDQTIFIWIVTSVFCLVIVIFAILFVADLLRKYRQKKYSQL